jgi:glycosyltransferase involved in cell wall biosynthesis
VVLGPAALRILNPWYQLLRTVVFLLRTSANTILVQNPSLLLTSVVCVVLPLVGKQAIQDLHSYFSLHIHGGRGIRGRVYSALSRLCIRRAKVTIVTNRELKNVVESYGGRALVLQDAIPRFEAREVVLLPGRPRVVFICTYSADEPVEEVIRAAADLPSEARIYITGRVPPRMHSRSLPPNVVLTGFLPEKEYLGMLQVADAVMVLTTREHTLVCGAYEALAFHKPLILSNKPALREYFGDAAIYVGNDSASIVGGIEQACSPQFEGSRIVEAVKTLRSDWQQAFADLDALISHAY